MVVKQVNDESQFQQELTSAQGRLVVVDFYATWYVTMFVTC